MMNKLYELLALIRVDGLTDKILKIRCPNQLTSNCLIQFFVRIKKYPIQTL